MKIKINNEIENKYVFLCLLLLGADKISIQFGGITIRIVQILLAILTMIYIVSKRYKINVRVGLFFGVIVIVHTMSILVSYDLKKSILFTIWVIYTLICVIYTIYSWALNKESEELIDIYLRVFRIVGYLSIIHFIMINIGVNIPIFKNDIYMGIGRPSVWFYEPSYLATYFSLYFGLSIYLYINTKEKKYTKEIFLAIIFISFSTSTTGYLSIVIGLVLMICNNLMKFITSLKINKSYLKKYSLILSIIFIVIIFIYILEKDIINIFIGRLFKDGVTTSSGERIDGFGLPISIFKEYPLLGIGAGAFEKYANISTPPTNVTLEILCTTGVLGLISFIIFGGFIYFYQKDIQNNIVKAMGFSLVLFLIILQANQNYLRIYMWGHISLYISMIYSEKRKACLQIKERNMNNENIYRL